MNEPPDLGPEPGWRELAPPQAVAGRSFVSGDPQGDRLRVRYVAREDGSLAAKVWFGPGAEGPPGKAAAWLAGHVAGTGGGTRTAGEA